MTKGVKFFERMDERQAALHQRLELAQHLPQSRAKWAPAGMNILARDGRRGRNPSLTQA